MTRRNDLMIEALAGACAAAATLAAVDGLQVARRVQARVGPHGPAPRRAILASAIEARAAEALVAMLVFRGVMGVSRRVLRRWLAPARLRATTPPADWTPAPVGAGARRLRGEPLSP